MTDTYKINFLEMKIAIQQTFIHNLEKYIGNPDMPQRKLRKEISEAKKELVQMQAERANLIEKQLGELEP